jgi:hypothetical protein
MYPSGPLVGQWNDAPETLDVTNQAIVEYSLSGTFSVAANSPSGTLFTVPAGATSCQFNASGAWNFGSGLSASADGNPTWTAAGYIKLLPSATYFSLIANTPNGYRAIGANQTLLVPAGQLLTFQINEGIGVGDSYADNSGALSVAYQCQ